MEEDRIIALARALAKAIQEDGRYLNLKKAREDNDADGALQDAIGRFNLAKFNLNAEVMKEERDPERVSKLNDEVQATYEEIMSNEGMARYQEAKAPVDAMYSFVETIITSAINGQDPDAIDEPAACTGDCSGCKGCH